MCNIMKIINKTITIPTKCENDIIDLSNLVEKEIRSTDIKNGSVIVFTKHSTAAITTIELDAGLEKDFTDMLQRLAHCLIYTYPSPRDATLSHIPSSA